MVEDLNLRYPSWSIWRSDAGGWYATRRTTHLSNAAINAGLVMTAVADDPESLDATLAEQEHLAEQSL